MVREARKPSNEEPLSDFDQDDAEKASSIFELFGGSVNRSMFFTAFLDGITEAELRERFDDVANNTVDNNIEAFAEENEIIYYSDRYGEYRLTEFGQRLIDPFREIVELAHCHNETRPLLRHLPSWSEIFDYGHLTQISKDNITEYNGRREMAQLYPDFADIVRGNSTVREVLTWNAHDTLMEDFLAMFTEGDTTGELVLRRGEIVDKPPDEGGMSREHAELLAENGAELYVYEEDYPPGVLFVGDETAAIWGWGPEDTYIKAGIYEGESLYDWAIDLFEHQKSEANADWENYEWVDE